MNFWDIILGLLGGGAVAGIISLYNAKANNTSIQADTFKKFFDEVQEWSKSEIAKYADEIKLLKEERAEWFAKFDEYKAKNDQNIEAINKHIAIKDCALNSAYRCPFPDNIHDCPVVATLDEMIAREREEGE